MSESFKDRIKRLHDAHRRGRDTGNGPAGVYTADDQPGAEDDDEPPEPTGYGWQQLGAEKTNDYGAPLWVHRKLCDHDNDHGDWTIADCCDVQHRRLANLDDDIPESIRRSHLLYMDIETTGLSDNAIAFMLGIGYWKSADQFVVEQFMLDQKEHEPALLKAFAHRLDDQQLLVTFNGNRFDVPVLQRRYQHHGLDDPLDGVPHLDLLPFSRRSFPGLTSYRLSKLEQEVLAFTRVDDVPGRDVPQRWWRFQKTGNAELVRGVLEHNHHDIVSLEALVAAAITGVRPDPSPSRPAEQPESSPRRHKKPKNRVASKLERTYRLRGKFADSSSASSARTSPHPSANTEPAAAPDQPLPQPVASRADQLRSAARSLLDQNMWREAFPLLCELVAIAPDDPWGLEKLAQWHRREGNHELADHLQTRADS